jgi:hypothetical protein
VKEAAEELQRIARWGTQCPMRPNSSPKDTPLDDDPDEGDIIDSLKGNMVSLKT